MRLTVLYFASVRELMGTERETVETHSVTVAALRAELMSRGVAAKQALSAARAVRVAVDQQMADDATLLHAGAEVAFFPPVTGG